MYLCEDIILLILARLSVLSLVRFKCVCKSWHSLIKSSILINKHLSFSYDRVPQQLMMETSSKPDVKTMLSFHSIDDLLRVTAPNLEVSGLGSKLWYHECLRFIGSCNGIVCMADSRIIIMCNPALREFRTLPPSSFRRTHENHGGVVFFHVSTGYGFGFDQISNDYKVVCIFSFRPEGWDWNRPHSGSRYSTAEIYNLKTDAWRETNSILPHHFLPTSSFSFSSSGVLFNECFHWLSESGSGIGDLLILSFHLSTEEFRTIRTPPTDFSGSPYRRTLTVLHESLSSLAWTEDGNINVWVMNRYGFEESWTRQYIIQPLFIDTWDTMYLSEGTLLSSSEAVTENWFQSLVWPYDILLGPRSLNGRSLRRAIYKESLVSITRDYRIS